MKILAFEKVTLTDYEGVISSVIFTGGCNIRCRFCHNKELLFVNKPSLYEEFINYIKNSKVEGVSITGGEPLINNNLEVFLSILKSYNLKVKLDTNGFLPTKLEKLVSLGMIDYIAIDIKGLNDDEVKFITRSKVSLNDTLSSISIVKKYSIPYELRVTVWKDFHEKDIKKFISIVGKKTDIYLQKIRTEFGILDKSYIKELNSVNFGTVVERFSKYCKVTIRQ